MNHHNQSNLVEIFNKDFKAEKLKIGTIALNAHYSVIPMPEIAGIYVIDADTEDDTFAEKLEKLNTYNGWVHLAAGLSLFVENQHITIIKMQRKYIETVAHFSQKDILELIGKPDEKVEDRYEEFYASRLLFDCNIWYYYNLQLAILFDVNVTKQIEQIQIGGLSNLVEIQKQLNSEIDLSFWGEIKFFFTGKLDFRQKEKPKPAFPVLTKSIYELKQGESYRVIKEFIDHDHGIHPVGETWIFDHTDYLPYHSGLSLFVIENGQKVQHRFQDLEEEQADLLRTFMDYVELIKE
jgi:hypothetical protein